MTGEAIRYATVGGSAFSVIWLAIMMSQRWRRLSGSAQQLRYWALLLYAMSFAYGGAEGLAEETPFGFRHVVAFVTMIFMLAAMYYTYREDVRGD